MSMSEQHNTSGSMKFHQKLLYCIGRENYVGIAVIYMMMIVMAGLEVVCATLFVPFLAIVEDSTQVQDYAWLETMLGWFDLQTASQAIMFTCSLLLLAYVVKNGFSLFFQYYQANFIQKAQAYLATKLLKKYLLSDYIAHISRNSADLIRNINHDTFSVYSNVVRALLMVLVEAIVALAMLILLLVQNVYITLIAMCMFGTLGVLVYRLSQRYTYSYGQHSRVAKAGMIKWTMQSLGALKETKVMNKEYYFLSRYLEQAEEYKTYAVKYKVVSELPRNAMEVLGMITVLLMTLTLIKQSTMEGTLPTLGLFAVASFRILPSLTRITSGLSLIRFHKSSLDSVVDDFEDDAVDSDVMARETFEPLTFEREIRFDDVSFAYEEGAPDVIHHCSLSIGKGQSVAFVGASGAGKTTLIDLLLGLLKPDSGEIFIDDESIQGQEKRWQGNVGYISQPVYMLNDTVRANVAFGLRREDISDEDVWDALRQAQLEDVIQSLPEQLDTSIGESGVKLSGGQRQRLGIARVLFRNPDVLVFDEATSALDNQTEAEITRAIKALSLEKTVILIAHRFSTIEHCDNVFMLADGSVLAQGTYQDLLENCEPFKKLAMVIND